MADQSEPKKETVRITLPPPPGSSPPGNGDSRETVRINVASPADEEVAPARDPTRKFPLPPRPPAFPSSANSAVRPPAPPAVPPKAPPPAAPAGQQNTLPPRPRVLPPLKRVLPPAKSAVTAAPVQYPGSAAQSAPKKETARINILPEPSRAPTVKMSKTQPLLTVPAPAAPTTAAPVARPAITPQSAPAKLAVPASLAGAPVILLWIACALSAVALLIQIWNYFAS